MSIVSFFRAIIFIKEMFFGDMTLKEGFKAHRKTMILLIVTILSLMLNYVVVGKLVSAAVKIHGTEALTAENKKLQEQLAVALKNVCPAPEPVKPYTNEDRVRFTLENLGKIYPSVGKK
jgi:hypothetical protein